LVSEVFAGLLEAGPESELPCGCCAAQVVTSGSAPAFTAPWLAE
jgi:hypothetical protein